MITNDEIESVSNFISIIQKHKDDLIYNQIYYRGQRNGKSNNWELLPSFYRNKRGNSAPFYNNKGEELNEIYKFVEKNHESFVNVDFDDLISIINILQHFGFPTRVLDVTQNPLVALYFALDTINKSDRPVVYIVKSNKCIAGYSVNKYLNDFYKQNKTKFDSNLMLVNGSVLSERIKSQKGDFILFFKEDDIYKQDDFKVIEISIKYECIEKIKAELDVLGINRSLIYPSLEEEVQKFLSDLGSIDDLNKRIIEIADNNIVKKFNKTLNDEIDSKGTLSEKLERKYLKQRLFKDLDIKK